MPLLAGVWAGVEAGNTEMGCETARMTLTIFALQSQGDPGCGAITAVPSLRYCQWQQQGRQGGELLGVVVRPAKSLNGIRT